MGTGATHGTGATPRAGGATATTSSAGAAQAQIQSTNKEESRKRNKVVSWLENEEAASGLARSYVSSGVQTGTGYRV